MSFDGINHYFCSLDDAEAFSDSNSTVETSRTAAFSF
jgi:hypothetical protein